MLVGVCAYSVMLTSDFKMLDDQISIVENQDLRAFNNIPNLFFQSFFKENKYYRPLVALSFLLEYQAFKLNPYFYYLTNLILHLFNAVLVYFLLKQLLGQETKQLAFYISLLFVVHPIHWEAVTNIPGRSILLCALFYLGSFFHFVLSRGKPDSIRCQWHYLWSVFFFVLAILSKESAIMLPILLGCYLWLGESSSRGFSLAKGKLLIPFVLWGLFIILLRRYLDVTALSLWTSPGDALLGFVSFLRSVLTHLRLLVFPVGLYYDRTQILFTKFSNPEALLTIVIFIFAILFLCKLNKREI